MPPKKKVTSESTLFEDKVFTLSGTFHVDQKTIKDKIVESVNKPTGVKRVIDGNKQQVISTIVENKTVTKATDSEMDSIRRRAGIKA